MYNRYKENPSQWGRFVLEDGSTMNLADMFKIAYDGQAIEVLDKVKREMKRGNSFAAGNRFIAVANSGYAVIQLKTGNKAAYASYQIVADGKCYYDTYHNPTITTNGTELSIFHRNLIVSRTTTSRVFHTPTYSALGTSAVPRILAGGDHPSFSYPGIIVEPVSLIPPNSDILFVVQNKSGSTADINIVLDWFELSLDEIIDIE